MVCSKPAKVRWMNESKSCPECGAGVPDDSPLGVCPKCLLLAGLGDSHSAADATIPDQCDDVGETVANVSATRITRR